MELKQHIVKRGDLWYCERCNITSLSERMCPCPRGGCEAEIIGKVKESREISITKNNNKIKLI